MPRKYRPPAARRRKAKRQAPFYVEPLPDGAAAAAVPAGADESAYEEPEPPALVEREPAPVQAKASERTAATATRHIAKDYGYVRAEVKRIALVGGLLIISLIITALLRN